MIVFLNDKFVPEEQAVVSVFDRSFLYGDGLFETIRVWHGQPLHWAQHLERLELGAEFLKIQLPFAPDALRDFADQLIKQNSTPNATLRITLSRGVGGRGYSPKSAESPTLVMTLQPPPAFEVDNPPQWKLVTASLRLPVGDPLARFKTANKLAQILARAEADAANADEALLLNTDGHVAETASGNLFWIDRDTVCTLPLATGALPGVTRSVVLEICRKYKFPTREADVSPEQLHQADGIFLTLSSLGMVEVVSLDGRKVTTSPVFKKLWVLFQSELLQESSVR